MFLAIDIGNSSTKVGLHDGASWLQTERLEHPFENAFGCLPARMREAVVDTIGICSVVPPLTEQVVDDVRSHFNEADLYVVHHEMALPFEMAYETPETLGTDRLAAAAAAWLSYGAHSGRAVLVVDAGTAVTIEAITSSGVYLGGAIAPGPEMLRQSLSNETAQLPSIQWPETLKPIGRNTREAIEAGLSGLFLDGVRGLVNRTAGKLNTQPVVVATGGWASWISYHLEEIDVVAPDLVLDGIRTLVNYQFET